MKIQIFPTPYLMVYNGNVSIVTQGSKALIARVL